LHMSIWPQKEYDDESFRNDLRHLVSLLGLLIIAGLISVAGSYLKASFISAKEIEKAEPVVDTVIPASTTEIIHGDKTKNQIIFTFDGGATAVSANLILDVLAKHSLTSTFFLTGEFVQKYPDIVKRMDSEHQEIYSHTFSHPHLTTLSDEEIRGELQKMSDILFSTIGKNPRPYFRAPYGDRDDRVLKIAAEEGYQSVYWTEDALDWKETEGVTADDVRDLVLSTAAPGNIYLMHLGDTISGSILDDIINKLEAKGYNIVSLTQGL
jgi:peptidoglycan/xylan/chitin deacetylase (PgdA/CDA1 family)